ARTVGSPPVSRTPVTPRRVNTSTMRVISSNVRSASRGSHTMPSSGMQYVQRKLQRSVTDTRRSRTTRPKPSTSSIPLLSVPRLAQPPQQQHLDLGAGVEPVAVRHHRQGVGEGG